VADHLHPALAEHRRHVEDEADDHGRDDGEDDGEMVDLRGHGGLLTGSS
jgi:hypothetical protein